MRIENLDRVESFVTLDGSTIRELAGPASGNAENQSLAEAAVPAGRRDRRALPPHDRGDLSLHPRRGRMRLGAEEREVNAGDAVVIAPGVPHKLWNTGE